MPKRAAGRAQPKHATVRFQMPVWTSRKQRTTVAAAIVAAALGTLASAGVGPHRVDAEPAHPATNTQSSGAPLAFPSDGLPSSGGQPPTSRQIGPPATPSVPRLINNPTPSGPLAPELAGDGIPAVALAAYRKAAAGVAVTDPGCGLPWPLLAAIGRVESDHGRFADSQLYADGTSAPRVIGIPLNGHGTALIRDTDHGVLDGDTVYDRAVGPMQFIPSTWATWGVDGNGDGVVSPFNIYDAALAAAHYLCAAGGNLGTADGQVKAVLTYNDSAAYLATVLSLEKIYAAGAPGVTIPILPAVPNPTPREKPVLPPADPGPPLGLSPTSPKQPARSGSGSNAGSSSHPGTSGGSTSTSPTPSDSPPAVLLKVTQKPGAPLDIAVDASGSTDDHGITGFSFDFGDGSAKVTGTAAAAAHDYTKAGVYSIVVTATDGVGHQSSATVKLTVDAPPTPALTATQTAGSLEVTADAAGSKDDDGMGIASYTFDFGDNSAPVTVTSGTIAKHTYAAAGNYTVTVTVTDTAGKKSSTTKPIAVTAPSSTTTPPSTGDTTPAGDSTPPAGTGSSAGSASSAADPAASTS
jgi:membrane-bound lytic murein transglycosylase B/PKD repeat protein